MKAHHLPVKNTFIHMEHPSSCQIRSRLRKASSAPELGSLVMCATPEWGNDATVAVQEVPTKCGSGESAFERDRLILIPCPRAFHEEHLIDVCAFDHAGPTEDDFFPFGPDADSGTSDDEDYYIDDSIGTQLPYELHGCSVEAARPLVSAPSIPSEMTFGEVSKFADVESYEGKRLDIFVSRTSYVDQSKTECVPQANERIDSDQPVFYARAPMRFDVAPDVHDQRSRFRREAKRASLDRAIDGTKLEAPSCSAVFLKNESSYPPKSRSDFRASMPRRHAQVETVNPGSLQAYPDGKAHAVGCRLASCRSSRWDKVFNEASSERAPYVLPNKESELYVGKRCNAAKPCAYLSTVPVNCQSGAPNRAHDGNASIFVVVPRINSSVVTSR
eukprot:TRINITY_DN28792_c0_g1_i1.p1 TRINITY_DN28792_c0_g1~~TRINITY_DN28792_c0_g1_i1.p1  ORF type:complete len:412 (-),score=34.64 TRINITY_DN28792_c0_g1_i1:495-1658(-)